MNGDLLAVLLGAASLGIYLGYRICRKVRRNARREQLRRLCEKEETYL